MVHVLAMTSAPGTGKSRLLDELPTMAASCPPAAQAYLEAVERGRRIKVTFGSGNGPPTEVEVKLGVGVTLALQTLHACFRRTLLDDFGRSPIPGLVGQWATNSNLTDKLTLTAVIDRQ